MINISWAYQSRPRP